jgi:membrane protease YdiL (CAAX protease family)
MAIAARRRIILFLVLTYALSSIFYALIISNGKMKAFPTLGLMWCPGVAALITRLATQRNLRGTGWGWGKTRWQVLAYLLPAGLALVVYGLVWATGLGGLSTAALIESAKGIPVSISLIVALFATLGLIPAMVFALGEEIGWRGLLVPELATATSFTKTALLSGAAWSVYHYPLILFANYNTTGAPKWFALIAFTWMAVAASFAFAWLRLKSGSLWTAVILHASHNLFIQSIFDPLTKDRGITKYLTTEFGVGLALVYTFVAWYFWRRRAELPQPKEAAAPAAVPAPGQAGT